MRFRRENVFSFESSRRQDGRRKRTEVLAESEPSKVHAEKKISGVDRIGTFPVDPNRDRMHHAPLVVTGNPPDRGCRLSSKQAYQLCDALVESWNNHSVPLVMHKFSFDMVYDTKNVFKTLASAIASAKERSALHQACLTIGCAYIGVQTRSPDTVLQLRMYGKALKVVKLALQDPEQYKTNNTIFAIWLLIIYEV
jgi:hypothetical protein